MVRMEALTETLEPVAQNGMELELLQEVRELMLKNVENMFCRGLTGERLALVTPMVLR